MRTSALVLLASVIALTLALTPAADARTGAEAAVVSGDLARLGYVSAPGRGTDSQSGTFVRPGIRVGAGRAAVRGGKRAGALVAAEDISIFDGLVTAERVTRSAKAGQPLAGAVTGLVVGGEKRADGTAPAGYETGDVRVGVNSDGFGLRATLLRSVAGFAEGTTVVIADVTAFVSERAVEPDPNRRAEPETKRPRSRRVREIQRLARGDFIFPIYGKARCADAWGAARQIGAHQGNDCFANFGSPVLAVADGTLNRVGTLPLSGNRLWLKTDEGDAFFYAHMASFAPGAVSGKRVEAGTLLGFVGNTGDAEPTPPHIHFEIHPGDRSAIDPHKILSAWQRNGRAPTEDWVTRYGRDTAERPGALVAMRDFIAGG